MMILGLTGSIGMGKSTIAGMFADQGVPVFDSDAAVHEMIGPGGAALAQIAAAFPGSAGPGGVDRAKLGALVFQDPARKKDLEAILHPLVLAAQTTWIETQRRAGRDIVLLDIPLLFETGGEARVDKVVVVSAPTDIQRARVLGRPGMTAAKFEGILKSQLADAEKRRRADWVIDTRGDKALARERVKAIIAEIRNQEMAG